MKSIQNWPGDLFGSAGLGPRRITRSSKPLRLQRPRERLLDDEDDAMPALAQDTRRSRRSCSSGPNAPSGKNTIVRRVMSRRLLAIRDAGLRLIHGIIADLRPRLLEGRDDRTTCSAEGPRSPRGPPRPAITAPRSANPQRIGRKRVRGPVPNPRASIARASRSPWRMARTSRPTSSRGCQLPRRPRIRRAWRRVVRSSANRGTAWYAASAP